jgi:hypothetical protein
MSKIVKDIKDVKNDKNCKKLRIKKLTTNPIFRRSNYSEYSESIDDNYQTYVPIYCNIENKFCGLCFTEQAPELYMCDIKASCIVPLVVLNKIYKCNRKNQNIYGVCFMNNEYECIHLYKDPYYKWQIDCYVIHAENEDGDKIKYCVNITRIEKRKKIIDKFVPSI